MNPTTSKNAAQVAIGKTKTRKSPTKGEKITHRTLAPSFYAEVEKLEARPAPQPGSPSDFEVTLFRLQVAAEKSFTKVKRLRDELAEARTDAKEADEAVSRYIREYRLERQLSFPMFAQTWL
ncbi:MAG: hypothetical protein KGM43_03155 [Planctomycetota bacterium]|nr:hypothetical protein [Planctomycetota bacterium]